MSITNNIKNYYPPKILSFKSRDLSKDRITTTTQPLQQQKHDLENRTENHNVTTPHIMKKSSIISTNTTPSINSNPNNSQDLSRPQDNKNSLLLVIDGYEKRIKELMR